MPDKSKAPKELVGLAAQQSTHAAKNVAAAASETVGELLPVINAPGFSIKVEVSNKVLTAVAASASVIAATAVVTRIRREKELKAQAEKNGRLGVVAVEHPVDKTIKP